MSEDKPGAFPRMNLLVGAGLGAAALLGPSGTQPAAAEPNGPGPTAGPPNASPVGVTLASPPLSGYTYAYRSMWDFTPDRAVGRNWTAEGGVYCNSGELWTNVEIPAGARVRDIEWYAWNNTGSTITAEGRLWVAGTPFLNMIVADTPISSGQGVRRFRSVVPSASYGPHPPGTMLSLGMPTPNDKAAGINGLRVGFDQGAGRTGLLRTPVRVYDSRDTGGMLASGSTRTINLASAVKPGTAGIVANIMALGSTGKGALTVFAADTQKPAVTTLRYDAGQLISNTATVGISASREINVYASAKTHVIVDLVATIA